MKAIDDTNAQEGGQHENKPKQPHSITRGKKQLLAIITLALLLIGGYAALLYDEHKDAILETDRRKSTLLSEAYQFSRLSSKQEITALINRINFEDAKLLLDLVAEPARYITNFMAADLCSLLSILAENDKRIEELIFDRLDNDANIIATEHYKRLLEKLGNADIEGISEKLIQLTILLNKKNELKNKDEKLAVIWQAIGPQASEKHIPIILSLLHTPNIGNTVINSLTGCLSNIIERIGDEEERSKVADTIFERIPEKLRPQLITSFAKARSNKALKYYSARLKDEENWSGELIFLGSWGDDSQLPTLLALEKACDKKSKNYDSIISALKTSLYQNRSRETPEMRALISTIYDKIAVDTSDIFRVKIKIDPASKAFLGEDHPELASLRKKFEFLEKCSRQQLELLNSLAELREYIWVREIISSYCATESYKPYKSVIHAADKALESIKKNSVEYQERRESEREKAGK